jgi:hypothetical protein
MGYEAFVIDEQTRGDLLQRFPPKFPDVVCHHITNLFVRKQDDRPFGQRFVFTVVGYASDDKCETLVVARSGSAVRPDGGTYHITLSVDRSKGAKPFDSNALIAKGYERVADPFTFPATFEYLT